MQRKNKPKPHIISKKRCSNRSLKHNARHECDNCRRAFPGCELPSCKESEAITVKIKKTEYNEIKNVAYVSSQQQGRTLLQRMWERMKGLIS